MSCRGGCFCTKNSLVVRSSKTSCSKPISTLRKETSTKPSSPPLYYRGGGSGRSGYSKPSAPQSNIVSRSNPVIKAKKVALSKPGSVIVSSRSGGSSNTKPSAVQSKPSGKTKTNPATSSSGCGSDIYNAKSSAPLRNTPIEKSKEPSKQTSSIASASNPPKHCIASQNTSTSPPRTEPKISTKSSVLVKITVRTPQTTIEQETAFDIDS